ncbi:phytanoyl-CoA dioxygenase family protein [Candidatus Pelagibacter sp.]|nr:phytanoyl-CoA dioxygenase family protein [Candidatus Pelagibacter sp.]MDC0992586.1 phytanoyl-CoA dioxygenase family protein [Candidatus Pelagibacter sp.]
MQKNLLNLNTPWVESELFGDNLKYKEKKFIKYAKKFNKDGYVVIDLKVSKKDLKKTIEDISNLAKAESVKKNPKIYHYNKNPRIVEGYKKFKSIKNLCKNKEIINILKYFYEKKPIPINSINFIKGTDQPLHSDYIHFSSMPHKYLCAAWIALEKTDEKNGPIIVVPGSHKFDLVDYSLFNLKTPTSMQELSRFYKVYETYVNKLVKLKKIKTKTLKLQPGQAVIWAANLLHGGKKIIDQSRTRFSQVIHYHFDKCDFVYNPGFSNVSKGQYALRNLDKLKII